MLSTLSLPLGPKVDFFSDGGIELQFELGWLWNVLYKQPKLTLQLILYNNIIFNNYDINYIIIYIMIIVI